MLVKLAAIFFSMILVNNYVLVKFYGICPFLGVSKKLDSSIGMSGAVIFVMLVATAVTFPIQIFILDPAGLGYLQTIVFILVIAVLVQFIEIFLKKYVVALYNSLGVYLPLITTTSCVLAVTIQVVADYGADDERSMAANNSSAFNYRITTGSTKLSAHARGLAVDINPLYNPSRRTVGGKVVVEPRQGRKYLQREAKFPYKIAKGDLCYRLFTAREFVWGGNWRTVKDYQHFEIRK